MIRDREQRGGQQRLAARADVSPEPVQQRDGGRPEEHGGKADRPGRLAERADREVRQRRIERVVIVTRERRDHPAEGHAEEIDERIDLVDPEAAVRPHHRSTSARSVSATTVAISVVVMGRGVEDVSLTLNPRRRAS
jgi:hypothetical protein